MDNYIIGINSLLPDSFSKINISSIKKTSYVSGNILVDKSSPYYPARSDEKIMRQDVKASIIVINELIKEMGLINEVANMPLFVANGAFIEDSDKYLTRISTVYKKFTQETSEEERIKKIYMASPPLVALETLTNSTMSFIAQYVGFKGHNTTFGNTSLSAYYSLKEAIDSMDEEGKSCVLSSNSGGNHSFLTNSSVLGYTDGWHESASVGCIVLSNSTRYSENQLCKITHLKHGVNIPDLESNELSQNWEALLPDKYADLVIFSGAFTEKTYIMDEKYCNCMCDATYSLFKEYGNLGSSNIILSLIKGIEFLNDGHKIIDVLDRDVYGRESLIRIEKC